MSEQNFYFLSIALLVNLVLIYFQFRKIEKIHDTFEKRISNLEDIDNYHG